MPGSDANLEKEHSQEVDVISYPTRDSEVKKKIRNMIDARDEASLREFLEEQYPADIADLVGGLKIERGMFLFSLLDEETRGEVLHQLEDDQRRQYIEELTSVELVNIIREQESDEAVDLLEDMDTLKTSEVLTRIPPEERLQLTELMSYPENSAGSIMAKEFIVLKETDTVRKALTAIRRSDDSADFYTVFVKDEEGKYLGHVGLRSLLKAKPKSAISKIMENELLPLQVTMDQEEVANFFTRYDFITAPVVNESGVMLGRITADDVMEVMQEEASEDILRMGGVISGDETLSSPIFKSSAKRILWLGMNLVTAFLAAAVVDSFSATIHQAVILAALMPIVAGMGGNAASQTVAVIVRNIALGELSFENAKQAILREVTMGLFNGLALGLVTGLIVYFLTTDSQGYGKSLVLGSIIALAMLSNMLVAAITGASIPLVLKRVKVDPAIASSIFVTTCTDVLGFSTFLGLASLAIWKGWL